MTSRCALSFSLKSVWPVVSFMLVCLAFGVSATPALAKACTVEELATAVDEVGASLRQYNETAMPDIDAKMQQLRLKKGWSEQDYLTLSADYLHDARMAGLDEKANRLLLRIDSLGPREGETDIACTRITDVRASGLELLAVMKAKTALTFHKIDAELGGAAAGARANADANADASFSGTDVAAVDPDPLADAPQPARANVKKPPPRAVKPAPTAAAPAAPGRGNDEDFDGGNPWEAGTNVAVKAPEAHVAPGSGEPGYTIEEIRDATRGFFGTISTNLATVIEHAFKSWGRPSAYVLGNEGGGAFLAGLRYGKGTLYLRAGGRRRVFWHGPSVGSDIGAEGARTMFLIYNLSSADSLYRSYTGVDGSAYLVGGVGLTVLKGGKVIMAPIRTGVGLRLGANLGYVRFTPTATWNPF